MLAPSFKKILFSWPVLVFLLVGCTPPPGWAGSPYVRASLANAIVETDLNWGKPADAHSAELTAGHDVKVKIYQGKPQKILTRGYTFKHREGESTGEGVFTPPRAGELSFTGNRFGFNGATYYGRLQILKVNGEALYVNILPSEEYLVSVVAHEMSPEWPLEALKAQAVVARTYLLQRMIENSESSFHITSTIDHQVYKGIPKNADNVRKAVIETQKEILEYEGKMAQVFYHSCSGGYTASAHEIWGHDVPYLKAQISPYCKDTPAYSWQVNYPLTEVSKKLNLGTIKSAKVADRSQSKRAITLQFVTDKGIKKVAARDFRKALGTTQVKSTMLDLKITKDKVFVSGYGYGHGVGLSQWGSKIMAEQHRKEYRSILSFYFPGTNLSKSES